MRIEIIKLRKNIFTDVTDALVDAYTNQKYVLVERENDYSCLLIPVDRTYTIIVDDDGFSVDLREFIKFKDPDLFNWERCTFTVIEKEKVKINVDFN